MAETEIQFKVPTFLAALLAGGQSRQKCPPDPQMVGAVEVRVQQIELTSNAIRHAGERTEVAQEIVVHVAAEDDVRGHLDGPPATVVQIPTCALIAVKYLPQGRQCEIRLDFDVIEPRSLPQLPPGLEARAVEELIERKVEEAFPPVKETIHFDAFMPQDATIVTAGVSVSADNQLIAFRAELGPVTGSSAQAWKGFFDGFFADHLGSEDWGMFLPRDMLVENFVRQIRKAAESSPSSLFTIGQVTGAYTPAGDRAHIQLGVEVRLHPPDPFETIVIHTGAGVDLAQGEPGFLTTDIFLPDLETAIDAIHVGIDIALIALLGPVGIGIQALIDAALRDVKVPGDLGGMQNCWLVAPLHVRCRARLPEATLGETSLRLTVFSAQPEGVLLGGRLWVPPLTPSTLDTQVRRWRWKLTELSCPSPRLTPSSDPMVMVAAEVTLDHDGTTPVYICDVSVLEGSPKKFPRSKISWDDSRLPTKIVFEVPDPGHDYQEDPYPVRLLVKTTLGARVFELGKVTELDEAAQIGLRAEVVEKMNRCKIILMIPGFDLKWTIDPPFDMIAQHRWEILVRGLQPSEMLKLFDHVGRQLIQAGAQPGIATMLSAMVAPAGAGELKFMRLLDGDSTLPAEIGMEIRQQQVLQGAVLPFAGACKRVFGSALLSRHGALAVLDDRLTAFDFGNPWLPRHLGSWQIDGLRDALEWDGGVLAFSGTGFHSIDEEGSLHRVGPSEEPAPIVDVVAGAEVLYVLTETSLEVRSPELETISSQPFEQGNCLLAYDRHLVVGCRFGLKIFPFGEGGEIPADSDYAWPDFTVTELEAAPPGGGGKALAKLANGTARLFAIDEKGTAQEFAEFTSRPWFAGGAEVGPALLLLEPDSRSLRTGIPGKAHLVGAEAATVAR